MDVRLNRREFFGAMSLGTAALVTRNCSGASRGLDKREKKKPNLLFIWTDEQRADTMAAYGNTKIHTPNLNKLAKESVVFERAYVTQPVCSPNRSAVMTGLWPHTTGVSANNIPLRRDTLCLPELLNDPDYHTAYMGKWHLGDEIFAQHGFEEWVSIEYYDAYYSKGRDHREKPDYHNFLLENGYKPDVRDKYFSRAFATRRPLEQCKPKFLEKKACDFLRRHRNEPFVLYINFLEPHMPFFGPLDSEHDPAMVGLPANFDDPLEENEPLRYRLLREYYGSKYGKDEKDIRELTAKYWGLVTQVDLSVGAILKTLENLGLAENTIVVYTSDHGDMMGAHRMVEKSVMYEEAVRVPWLMRIPQMERKQRFVKGRVSQINMIPTLLHLMGAKSGYNLQGKSLVPLISSGRPARDHIFIQWNPGPGAIRRTDQVKALVSTEELDRVANEHTRTVISPDGWKLCLSDADKCQLFNLNSDPGERTNLFDSGRHKDVIGRLTKRVHEWQESVTDNVNL